MLTETKVKKLYTIEEFMALPEPADGTRQELVDGEIEEMPPAGEEHGDIEGNIYTALRLFVKKHRLGKVYPGDTGFVLGSRTVRAPDTGFVSAKRRSPDTREKGAVPIPPDLAVEIISPSGKPKRVNKKLREYLKAGVQLIWLIYPDNQEVHVYRAGNSEKEILGINDTLDGEEVVKDFRMPIRELFE